MSNSLIRFKKLELLALLLVLPKSPRFIPVNTISFMF